MKNGDKVTLQSRRGMISVHTKVTEKIKEGVGWTTSHFAATSANRLTNDVPDKRAKISEYKIATAEALVYVDVGTGGAEPPNNQRFKLLIHEVAFSEERAVRPTASETSAGRVRSRAQVIRISNYLI